MVFHILANLSGGDNIYPLIFHDIMRVIIIQVSTHILFYLSHHNIPLFSQYLIETLMFMVASLCVYWFCFYTIFPIEWKSNGTSANNGRQNRDNSSTGDMINTITGDTIRGDTMSDISDGTPSVISLTGGE
jgi:hypothetical protein